VKQGFRVALCVALMLGPLAGCANSAGKPAAKASSGAQTGAPWDSDPPPAGAGLKIGGSGTACQLPVSFDVAASWRAKPATGDLGTQGDFTLRCEIDAKPAGHLGFLRVWVGGKADDQPVAALRAFLADQPGIAERHDRSTMAGALPAAEVTYVSGDASAGARRRERVLAVATTAGVVVLSLGGLDEAEHAAMLPAYQLAKQSITETK
jgi:hypothetical protein